MRDACIARYQRSTGLPGVACAPLPLLSSGIVARVNKGDAGRGDDDQGDGDEKKTATKNNSSVNGVVARDKIARNSTWMQQFWLGKLRQSEQNTHIYIYKYFAFHFLYKFT